ncbi:Spt20 family-domain-containing protein [Phakopsora pachyrhizi]|uniref:Spt20 family-domain-containing protein n=1 Tax=Phakopsora pachyrhizi TaxID=170000 RepID=A0AAV0BHV9_PHAPC|nr:Spt20 family-domain-containing protein [Phakopsora pachyrhizi]CAH7686135.1 Spt20 family-domain-containing protein [Phakopsora pachyrhizi]
MSFRNPGLYNLTRINKSLLKRYRKDSPSLVMHLHTSGFKFGQKDSSNLHSYDGEMKHWMDCIREQRIPNELLDVLDESNIRFYDGCLIVEVHDHRSVEQSDQSQPDQQQSNNQNQTDQASKTTPTSNNNPPEQSSDLPNNQATVHRLVLNPTCETLWKDIQIMNEAKIAQLQGTSKSSRGQEFHWTPLTEQEAIELEAAILERTTPALCLSPSIITSRIANQMLVETALQPSNDHRMPRKRPLNSGEEEAMRRRRERQDKFIHIADGSYGQEFAPTFNRHDLIKRLKSAPPVKATPKDSMKNFNLQDYTLDHTGGTLTLQSTAAFQELQSSRTKGIVESTSEAQDTIMSNNNSVQPQQSVSGSQPPTSPPALPPPTTPAATTGPGPKKAVASKKKAAGTGAAKDTKKTAKATTSTSGQAAAGKKLSKKAQQELNMTPEEKAIAEEKRKKKAEQRRAQKEKKLAAAAAQAKALEQSQSLPNQADLPTSSNNNTSQPTAATPADSSSQNSIPVPNPSQSSFSNQDSIPVLSVIPDSAACDSIPVPNQFNSDSMIPVPNSQPDLGINPSNNSNSGFSIPVPSFDGGGDTLGGIPVLPISEQHMTMPVDSIPVPSNEEMIGSIPVLGVNQNNDIEVIVNNNSEGNGGVENSIIVPQTNQWNSFGEGDGSKNIETGGGIQQGGVTDEMSIDV